MKPWKMAVILAAGWFVSTVLVAILHTEILVPDLSPEQDEAISYQYGRAAALGALLAAVFGYQFQKRRSGS